MNDPKSLVTFFRSMADRLAAGEIQIESLDINQNLLPLSTANPFLQYAPTGEFNLNVTFKKKEVAA